MEHATKQLLGNDLRNYVRRINLRLSTLNMGVVRGHPPRRNAPLVSSQFFTSYSSINNTAAYTSLSTRVPKNIFAQRAPTIIFGDISGDIEDSTTFNSSQQRNGSFRSLTRPACRHFSTSSKSVAQSAILTGSPDASTWMSASSVSANDSAAMPAPFKTNVRVGRPAERGIFDFFKQADFSRTRASFRFDHAVAGFAKHPNRPVAPDTEIFLSERFGEDACFRRHDSLGVADGVGGITQLQGGDSSIISRKIMHYSSMELERYDNIEDEEFASYYDVDPVTILERGYDRAVKDMSQQGIEGATTACLAVLRDDELRIANLGDSGVLVLRQGDFVFRTEAQQRSFNVPYQLGYPTRDKPTDAQHFTVKLERGDIVILATDGMFDNLFDEDIIDEVTKCIRANTRGAANPVDISHALASRARDVSEDSRYATSPFQSRAVAEGFYYQGGGKLDDITVIVAVVSDLEDTPDRR